MLSMKSPKKVTILMEELSIPYELNNVDISEIKNEPYISINPNGRLPAIEDPNTGITLWESGAIIQYLVEKYDKDEKLSYTKAPEKYLLNQWLMFQVSGQGPYFGQAIWFTFFHAEQVPSAKERYVKEIERVTGVLDTWLQKHEYLVGDKCTYADLAFVPWYASARRIDAEKKVFDGKKYPAYEAWMDKLLSRPSVKKIMEPPK
jgi:glutathione S-transferase